MNEQKEKVEIIGKANMTPLDVSPYLSDEEKEEYAQEILDYKHMISWLETHIQDLTKGIEENPQYKSRFLSYFMRDIVESMEAQVAYINGQLEFLRRNLEILEKTLEKANIGEPVRFIYMLLDESIGEGREDMLKLIIRSKALE